MEAKPDLQLEIGHVLFIDIVGYSKLLIDEQREAQHTLNDLVRGTAQFRTSDAAGKLACLPTGDGMALIFRDNMEAPLRCAIEVSKASKGDTDFQVRMGIHSGPVSDVLDVNQRSNVAGAGMNTAQRVMDCGDAGHILLSKRVAEDLAQYRHWQPNLHDLGECEVKHGVRLGLVNFYALDAGNPGVPERLKCAREQQLTAVNVSVPPQGKSKALALGAVTLLLVLAGLWFYYHYAVPARVSSSATVPVATTAAPNPAGTLASDKSIAVLPFENLSSDKENTFFADGIQDEILTRLAKIGELKVISRTSTQRYKSAPENLRRIATELGVAHILEGSAQRSADHVRVNVQLINAASDTHLWAETYDRKLTDVFAVESEIAAKIADSLRAKLSGAEQKAIAVRPTQNNEAHELYLRGRYFAAKRTAEDFNKAIDYFDQAIVKDPNFALAYASLGESYALLPQWSDEPASESLQKAKAAADKAVAIDDNAAEAHTALALVFHGGALNFREAEREFERAIALNSNSATAHYFYGITVLASLGEFDRAIAELKRALELDPLSAIAGANLGYCYTLARRYPEAIAQLRRTVQLDPDLVYTHARLGNALALNGQITEAIEELQKTYELKKEYQPLVTLAYFYAAEGEREKATELLKQCQQIVKERPVRSYFQALMSIAGGDKDAAIGWLERSYLAKETGIITYIKVDPLLDPLRGDPRFEALANKIIASGR